MPRQQIPRATVLLAACSLVIYPLESLRGVVIYDRAAILHGQLWRLLTGHLVHFSPTHLGADLLVIVVAGWVLERNAPRLLPVLLGCSAFLISVALFGLQPQMAYFGGLSGLATAEIACLAVLGLKREGWAKGLSLGVLAGLCAKIAVEMGSGFTLPVLLAGEPYVSVPLAHGVGALVGLLLGLMQGRRSGLGSRGPGEAPP